MSPSSASVRPVGVAVAISAFIAVARAAFQPADLAALQTAVNNWCADQANMPDGTPIGDWDTSLVTSFSGLLTGKDCQNDNPDLSAWDTSKVTNFYVSFDPHGWVL